jgi:hypothetical protein
MRVGGTPSTMMFSPAAASRTPAEITSSKRATFETTWSEGKIPSTVAGSSFSMMKAVSAQAGAVLRATGSLRICCGRMVGICSVIILSSQWFVTTQTSAAAATGSNRARVC